MIANKNLLGAILLGTSWLFFTVEMTFVRLLVPDFSIYLIVFLRLATQAILLAPLAFHDWNKVSGTSRFKFHFLRATLSVLGMALFYFAFANLPMATATTLTFTVPAFVSILAAVFLSERVGLTRSLAILLGFLGVLVIMRPGFTIFEPAMIVALLGAFFAACLFVVTRSLSLSESRFTIMFYSAWLGLVIVSVPAYMSLTTINSVDAVKLGIVGLFGTIGQFLMVGALQIAEASAIAPVDYVRLLLALMVGFFVFGEVPDIWTWSGSAIIVAAVFLNSKDDLLSKKSI